MQLHKTGSSGFCLDKKAKAAHGRGEPFKKAAWSYAAVPHWLAILRASGDLGLPSDHEEKRLLRMPFV